jgi:hypothetical protein
MSMDFKEHFAYGVLGAHKSLVASSEDKDLLRRRMSLHSTVSVEFWNTLI